jgi:hypothetical protein
MVIMALAHKTLDHNFTDRHKAAQIHSAEKQLWQAIQEEIGNRPAKDFNPILWATTTLSPDLRKCPVSGRFFVMNPSGELWLASSNHPDEVAILSLLPLIIGDRTAYAAVALDGTVHLIESLPKWATSTESASGE